LFDYCVWTELLKTRNPYVQQVYEGGGKYFYEILIEEWYQFFFFFIIGSEKCCTANVREIKRRQTRHLLIADLPPRKIYATGEIEGKTILI